MGFSLADIVGLALFVCAGGTGKVPPESAWAVPALRLRPPAKQPTPPSPPNLAPRPLQLDELLAERGLAVAGKGAVAGVAIAQPGLVLFPLDQEQLREAQGEVQVGAVLVPLAALDSSSWEEEEGEERQGEEERGQPQAEGAAAPERA